VAAIISVMSGSGTVGRLPAAGLRRLGAGFWRLWAAGVVSNLGDGVSYVAYPWLAGSLTRDPLPIAGLPVAARLPWLLVTLPAGVLVDRVDRRRLMVATDTVRFAVTAAVGLAVVGGAMTLPLLYAAALALGCGQVLHDNAAQTVLPGLVPPAGLERANATMWGAEMVVGAFVGPPLGGALLAVGLAVPFLVDAGSFGAAAGLVLLVAGSFRGRPPGAARAPLRREVGDGLRWLWGHRLLRTLGLLAGAISLLMSVQYAVFVLYAQEVLRLDARGFGLLSTATAAGAVAGSQLAPALSRRVGPGPALLLAVAGLAPAYATIGLTSSPELAGAAFVAEGFLIMTWNVLTVSLRQQLVPGERFGRVNSVYQLLVHGATPFGSLAGGGLVAAVTAAAGREPGLRAPFLLAAAATAALAAAGMPLLGSRRIEAARAAAGVWDASRAERAGSRGGGPTCGS
jgi:MFS family permease